MSQPEAARRLRADARRNVETILESAETLLARDPDATVTQVAQHAGVGRVTLYGHFPSREQLVEAVLERVLAEANAILEAVDTGGDPREALVVLVSSSWEVVDRYRSVLAAAERELPEDRIRSHHDLHLERLTGIVERGRRSGAFRTDLPTLWLVTVCYTLMHAAAAEVSAGRLSSGEARAAVVRTITAALTTPAEDRG